MPGCAIHFIPVLAALASSASTSYVGKAMDDKLIKVQA
jgi:hypothetical protein